MLVGNTQPYTQAVFYLSDKTANMADPMSEAIINNFNYYNIVAIHHYGFPKRLQRKNKKQNMQCHYYNTPL